jgi:hypothetical protein
LVACQSHPRSNAARPGWFADIAVKGLPRFAA